ncbi:immunoglobulin kappa light chain-like isoform X2 [Seriola dumerili]|uniref:immunoglobulin kappa light chain-like isoform X1 n=1 Tax=Seriola dumerili TaxID=41447 RepID=UPI000BBEFEA4|nr:immunoglobulin kappa light chain-like isoform X1 [Seriola dumerili]XP_022607916.1 immunoglobulin kappa light chain-like isoform X2 [Seriola dumerili]
MTCAQFVFCLTCLFLGRMVQATDQKFSSSVRQERSFISANVGESLTLQCFFDNDDLPRIYWYKQSVGQKPRLLSTLYASNTNGSFHDEFQNNPRFTLDTGIGQNHLKITDLRISDSATYYCAKMTSIVIEFDEGATVSVKGSGLNIQAWVHQSGSETIQPGGSVTLSCTVHTGTCDGEHSVYWFKDSEESHPGLIYTHGDRNDQCEKKPETQTQTCVYNLPMQSLNLSHAGTYYCAVASCGHILFGNGTELDVEDEEHSLVLVYFLSGALAFTTILVVLLASLIYKMKKTNSFLSETQTRSSSSRADAEGYQDADNLHYAALNVKLPNRSSRQRDNTKTECVYSSVRQ